MINKLFKIPRKYKQVLLFVFDIFAILFCTFSSFSIRVGYLYVPIDQVNLFYIMLASPLIAMPIFLRFGLYHDVIRYVGFKAIWRISQATLLYAILWGLVAFMVANWEAFPRSAVIINWMLVVIFIGGSRLIVRWLISVAIHTTNFPKETNVIIFGAGSAGRQLSNALNESSEYNPIAFIDDSVDLQNQSINGLTVNSRHDIAKLINKNNIGEILLALPSLSHSKRAEIVDFIKQFPVNVRSVPGVSELAQGKVKVSDLHEIDIRDLLGRDEVVVNQNLLKTNITNKVVLVTGAGGSIGSEICRQVISLKPLKLILYDFSESSIYLIEQELNAINQFDVEIEPVIGSVTDYRRMRLAYEKYGVHTIYHAAAYKHVPLVECNPSQGILNNVFGTMIAANLAIASKVETFVLISTDKAVRPTSVMGASKRISELVIQGLFDCQDQTCFSIVRFGNVLDSSGSVIPLFKKQIRAGGPLTVTHPEVVRYFMTLPEAVELVIQAGAMAKGGEVFILDMGQPVRIYDLAVKMIQLSGLEVIDHNNSNGDIEIKFTGLRPGEKLYEELLVDGEFDKTENQLIMSALEEKISWDKLEPMLNKLKEASIKSETDQVYKLIKEIVPQFKLTRN